MKLDSYPIVSESMAYGHSAEHGFAVQPLAEDASRYLTVDTVRLSRQSENHDSFLAFSLPCPAFKGSNFASILVWERSEKPTTF